MSYAPLRMAPIIPQSTIPLYLLQKMVFNHSKNNDPPLLFAKECAQAFQKQQLSGFTCCKLLCSIIPKTSIRLYLLQGMMFNHSKNNYPLSLFAKDGAQSIQKTTIHL